MALNRPAPRGRVRCLYAVAVATLETAGFMVRALWLVCVVLLAALVVALLGGAFRAVF